MRERTDLTKGDKRKVMRQTRAVRKVVVESAANKMIENEKEEATEYLEKMVE